MALNISPDEMQKALTGGIIRMIEGTVDLGMKPSDAMNCLMTGMIVLTCNFENPAIELRKTAEYLLTDDATDAIKFYTKQRKKNV